MFPKKLTNVQAPPIKIQGIKTKLCAWIASSISWTESGRWIEPFLGSGAVAFNLRPTRATLSDTNPHIIRFYQAVQSGELDAFKLRAFLESEGSLLLSKGETHYYEVRTRFNELGSPFDFIFLNRASFNGIIRFNGKGKFNTPFCRKPERFQAAYVTRICNQVDWAARVMDGLDWKFVNRPWSDAIAAHSKSDFVYLDPPYIGRHADYFNNWTEAEASALAAAVRSLGCGFAYSMWKENVFRSNTHLSNEFSEYESLTFEHFYHVGSSEALRHSMLEALVVHPDHVIRTSSPSAHTPKQQSPQLALAI